ncbi:FAS1 domain-containing protein [Zychaea mexicana]|uniref:FAS1 domain-containing protein n=1 Tax=Zychaea mexicana TaxID=64656 RepID=UPI0022FDC878|nr:FAS1 domain-containing protein [Zychaea mexicana]KAI9488838.1 FAS1 domain-containing protein [Zychaea mexicana]
MRMIQSSLLLPVLAQLILIILALASLTVSSSVMQEKKKDSLSSFSSSSHSLLQQRGPQLLYNPNAPDYRCPEIQQSLFDKLAVDASLSTFMSALTQVESVLKLVNDSQLDPPFTVFAPINSAFTEFNDNDGDDRMHSNLEAFLRNHMVPSQKLSVEQLQRTQTLDTMLDDKDDETKTTIQVKYHFFSHRVELNGVAEVDTDHPIMADNGVAYKINKLLRPAKP